MLRAFPPFTATSGVQGTQSGTRQGHDRGTLPPVTHRSHCQQQAPDYQLLLTFLAAEAVNVSETTHQILLLRLFCVDKKNNYNKFCLKCLKISIYIITLFINRILEVNEVG